MVDQKKLTVVITGPSGVGKGTIVNHLLSDPLLKALRVPRHTTRNRRPDEAEGVTHCFVSAEAFLQIISETGFLEWKKAGRHLYGTALDSYKDALGNGQTILLDIGISSALQLQTTAEIQNSNVLLVFLSPVAKEVLSSGEGITQALTILEKRIKGRFSVESEELADRLKEGKEDLERSHLFANIVVCKEDSVQDAVDEIKGLILAHKTA